MEGRKIFARWFCSCWREWSTRHFICTNDQGLEFWLQLLTFWHWMTVKMLNGKGTGWQPVQTTDTYHDNNNNDNWNWRPPDVSTVWNIIFFFLFRRIDRNSTFNRYIPNGWRVRSCVIESVIYVLFFDSCLRRTVERMMMQLKKNI